MDFLSEYSVPKCEVVETSPFWWKTYGGYTPQQIGYLALRLKGINGKTIYDPMSGQAFSLCQMAWKGAHVRLSDLNPAPLLLATLRSPELLSQEKRLGDEIRSLIKPSKGFRRKKPKFSATWISDDLRVELEELGGVFGVDAVEDPFRMGSSFWTCNPTTRLFIALLVLAARAITSYRSTDNKTWLRQGGITPGITAREALLSSLNSWQNFASAVYQSNPLSGVLDVETSDAVTVPIERSPFADAIIVSPPYANRLDYSSLWAPETAILSAIVRRDPTHLKLLQVGTTVVKNRWPIDQDVTKLPKSIKESLKSIRKNDAWASESYYYPFFANYALSLQRSIVNWAQRLKRNGQMFVFVRDTVRKDELFPVARLVIETAISAGLRPSAEQPELKIIRSHIGQLRRQRATAGVYGLAQREWWLEFKKR